MSDNPSFRTTRKYLAPRWLTEGDGELVGYSLDVLKDSFAERVRLGHLARFPQNDASGNATAPSDALAAIGQDRRVVRGINESDVSYARRLRSWLDDRKTCGNPFALMRKLAEYTNAECAFRIVDIKGGWCYRSATGEESFYIRIEDSWNWYGVPYGMNWSRFWVIIYPRGRFAEGNDWGLGDEAWGSTEHTWGSTATLENVNVIRALISDWKPAGTRCENVLIAFDDNSFNPLAAEPDGTWARWSRNNAGTQVPTRLDTARYWDGINK